MKTDVYFAKKNNNMIIAYLNDKQQEVFLGITRYNFAPFFTNTLVFNNSAKITDILDGFGYTTIDKKEMEVGVKFKNIWKPFIQENVTKELNFDMLTLCRAKRNLSILVQKLQEIFLYVEPAKECLQTYSHKIKELLILSCTELENSFKFYNLGKNERTTDYVKLLNFVDLSKYKVSLIGYTDTFKSCPFEKWNSTSPTKSIPWYEAYTKIKHNSSENFQLATLENCLNAVMANVIMYAVRYSIRNLYLDNDICSNIFNTSFDFRIEDSLDFYIPSIECFPEYTYPEQPYFINDKVIGVQLVGTINQLPYEERPIK